MQELTVSYDEYVTVPIAFATSQVSPPTGLTATPVVGGGTFAAGTYFYEVTATTALGETTVSNEASAVVALNGSVNLAWTLPVGVITHIKVYRGTGAGLENTLVTTLGPTATAFTDTNVGAGGTPPGTNTATIQDTVLLTGAGEFRGFTLRETSGSASASVSIQDSATDLAECNLSSAGSETEGPWASGITLYGRVNMHVNSGAVKGIVWVGIPC